MGLGREIPGLDFRFEFVEINGNTFTAAGSAGAVGLETCIDKASQVKEGYQKKRYYGELL